MRSKKVKFRNYLKKQNMYLVPFCLRIPLMWFISVYDIPILQKIAIEISDIMKLQTQWNHLVVKIGRNCFKVAMHNYHISLQHIFVFLENQKMFVLSDKKHIFRNFGVTTPKFPYTEIDILKRICFPLFWLFRLQFVSILSNLRRIKVSSIFT